MSAALDDVDIRGGLSEIADVIRTVHLTNDPWEMYNSDEDLEDEPAPRVVLLSRERYEELLECEHEFEVMSK